MPISSQIDATKKLTVFKATGVLGYDDIISTVKSFYEGQPTENVLWDLTDITEIQVTSKQVETIANFDQRSKGARQKGKTALVAPQDHVFGLSRMFGAFSELKSVPFQINTFRTIEDAYQWFSEEDSS
jgi:hypothetical protein